MIFPAGTTFPILIPRLHVVFQWFEETSFLDDITFKLFYVTGTEDEPIENLVFSAEVPLKAELAAKPRPIPSGKTPKRMKMTPIAALASFQVSEPGKLSARVERLGETWGMGSIKLWVDTPAKDREKQADIELS